MTIWQTIDELIELVMRNDIVFKDDKFLSLLDQLAWQITEIKPSDPPVGKEIPENDYPAIRRAAQRAFPRWGYYNVAENVTINIGQSKVNVGDAIDDVTDIIDDLKKIYWSYQNESEDMASWHLLESFNMHWRAHMRSLQFYVHCLEVEQ
ncbi:DUF5063 domain-containing protein [Undibacterium parvum]|uniref:DUF5063 domain-containing protein n=1 Tax=Undibacterium parvum TaxID=401471 RepID=A0A3Q9BMY2_9BURK|nr:DUF5063 domain-containing protein [Undibacterium parvum]AZP10682.1 DUF5063 domain-containing protein [Undibacterium parvum]